MKTNTFKTSLALIAIGSAIGLGSSLIQGCKTTTTVTNGQTNTVTTLDPQRTADAIRVIIAAGVPFAVEQDTNSIAYLRAAAVVFKAAANKGEVDPAQLNAALAALSVKELRGPEARALVNAVVGIYKVSFGDAVSAQLDKTQWATPILDAVADGLFAALPPPGGPL